MKYLVILCDGMADTANPKILDGKTPMQMAKKPQMDFLAKNSMVGLCKTVAEGMKPGSDVANLSVMGYNTAECYTGRSPLEAASIGINLSETDVALRCNLVTLSDDEDYNSKTMVDYCAGDISSAEAAELIKTIEKELGNQIYSFYAGVSYRHCLVVKNGTVELGNMTPPHDISGRVVGGYLSTHKNAKPLIDLMKKSYNILKDHPVNLERIKRGEKPANSIWLWGEGKKPALQNFKEKFGVNASVISAVDLLKGIGILSGMQVPNVPGATGYIDTNFSGKVEAAKQAFLNGADLVYLHFEAPDECGHRGEAENKVRAIEIIDTVAVKELCEFLSTQDDYRLLIMPDHPTPLETQTHSAEPVPFLLYDSRTQQNGPCCFNEQTAKDSEIFIEHGPNIMKMLLEVE